jgi:hypothetical protein
MNRPEIVAPVAAAVAALAIGGIVLMWPTASKPVPSPARELACDSVHEALENSRYKALSVSQYIAIADVAKKSSNYAISAHGVEMDRLYHSMTESAAQGTEADRLYNSVMAAADLQLEALNLESDCRNQGFTKA